MKHRKILYHHRTQGRGAEGAHIRGMIDGFRSLGHEVDISGPPCVNLYGNSKGQGSADGYVSPLRASIIDFLRGFARYAPQCLFELAEVMYNLFAARRLERYLEKKNYDFIYERYSLNSVAATRAGRKKGIPVVVEVNDATVIERSRPLFFKNLAAKHEAEILGNAEVVITISNKFKGLLTGKYPSAAERILVLPNAVDYKKFQLREIKLERGELGIPREKTVVGCVGFFVKWHGIDFLIRSLADVVKANNLYILLVGDGPVRSEVEEVARTVGIADSVQFTGAIDAEDVPHYLNLIDICVIPDSNVHGSPMKLFEFMAMAKPVVLPRYQPLLDTLSDGADALFFDPRDTVGLKDAVLALVASPDLRNELGRRGLATLLSRHTWCNHCCNVLEAMGGEHTGKAGGASASTRGGEALSEETALAL